MENRSLNRAFTLIEVISVIGILGILASLSVSVVGNVNQNARKEKLFSDTKTINRAVMVYRASGGSLDSSDTADTVIAKLRKRATSKRIPGLSGGFLDPRIAPRAQTASEAATNGARVYWDTTSNTFLVAYSGSVAGIKEFYLDDDLAEVDGGTEDRDSLLLYAATATPNWIWDYEDVPLPTGPFGLGPIQIAVTEVPPTANPTTPAPVIPPLAPAVPGEPLKAPNFSIPGGSFPINYFELNVNIHDLNNSGISDIFYSVNYGVWQAYNDGLIPNSPNDSFRAQAIARTADYSNSPVTEVTYYAIGITLAPPGINTSLDSFGLFSNKPLIVDLFNTNQPGISEIRYRINGGAWMPYTSSFSLQRKDYPTGVNIEAQAFSPTNPQYYSSSSVSARLLSTESLKLVGDTTGSFHDPTGPSGMVSNLAPGDSSSHFQWGDDLNKSSYSQSTLDFTGNSFGNIAGGERFQLGFLDYYNGTIKTGSGADSIEFNLGLNLDVNGNIFNPFFAFSFDLIDVVNVNDPNNPQLDADYVLLDDSISSRTLIINDFEFEFRIELGNSTADGFAAFNEFHVLENKSAAVSVFGTFIEIGAADLTDPLATPFLPVDQNEGYVDIKEAVEDLLDQVKYEKRIAKDAKDDADDANYLVQMAADEAIKKGQEALSKNDEDDARARADLSMQFAMVATSEAQQARLAAIIAADAAADADAAASQANLLAQSDPGSERKAKEAVNEAIKANEEAIKAEAFAVDAELAAATARDYAAKADAWADSLGD